jgi:hypothetical protein
VGRINNPLRISNAIANINGINHYFVTQILVCTKVDHRVFWGPQLYIGFKEKQNKKNRILKFVI